jgi:hypothetical protein
VRLRWRDSALDKTIGYEMDAKAGCCTRATSKLCIQAGVYDEAGVLGGATVRFAACRWEIEQIVRFLNIR